MAEKVFPPRTIQYWKKDLHVQHEPYCGAEQYEYLSKEESDHLVAEMEAKTFKKAADFVRYKIVALGENINPHFKMAYEEAIRTIETWNMEGTSVMAASARENGK